MNHQRLRSALLLTGLPVVSATLMWGAMTVIDKPEERLSERLVPSVITEEVRQLSLESAVVARGEVAALNATTVSLSGDVGDLDGEPLYTGRLAAVGSKVRSGNVLVEISGRPVIALQGAVPMYRNLSEDMSGTDVLQLEQELAALGHFLGGPDSTFDAQTGGAVQSLYRTLGYEAVHEEPMTDD